MFEEDVSLSTARICSLQQFCSIHNTSSSSWSCIVQITPDYTQHSLTIHSPQHLIGFIYHIYCRYFCQLFMPYLWLCYISYTTSMCGLNWEHSFLVHCSITHTQTVIPLRIPKVYLLSNWINDNSKWSCLHKHKV